MVRDTQYSRSYLAMMIGQPFSRPPSGLARDGVEDAAFHLPPGPESLRDLAVLMMKELVRFSMSSLYGLNWLRIPSSSSLNTKLLFWMELLYFASLLTVNFRSITPF